VNDRRFFSNNPQTHSGLSPRRGLRVLLWLICFLSANAYAQGLDARLDRTRIGDGETVTLDLSATGNAQGAPDLNPLQADFDVVSQGQSSQVNIINGHMTSTHEWQIGLMPKRTGELTIPALHIGALSSQPLHLTVTEATDAAGDNANGQPVLVETDADQDKPFVQAQVTYKVRVLSQVPLANASLTEPSAGDAIVQRLGDDRHFQAQRNGETYDVIERTYAIFPQHSGALHIDGPVLTASIPVPDARQGSRGRSLGADPFGDMRRIFGSDPFVGLPDIGGMFQQMRTARVRGRNLNFDVQPQPADVKDTWLPARSVDLSERWSPDNASFRVGDPVTRTITLTTRGLSEAQLPSLAPPLPDNVKRYPDQPVTDTQVDGDTLVVTRTFKEALVPTAAGEVTVPEFTLPWWNTRTHQSQTARLPARQLHILPAPAGSGVSAQPPVQAPAVAPPAVSATHDSAQAALGNGGKSTAHASLPLFISASTHYWPWVAAIAIAGWIATLAVWWRSRVAGRREAVAGAAPSTSLSTLTARVRDACQANDSTAARRALLDWAARRWPEQRAPRGLSELAERIATDAARAQLAQLDRVLYDNGAERAWDGRTAWGVLEPALTGASGATRADADRALPGLYPG